jgi:hypothetical protein
MTHVHYCPDCENSRECLSRDCEKYASYLCLKCFEGLMCLHCHNALPGDAVSALRKEKTNQSDRAIESRS